MNCKRLLHATGVAVLLAGGLLLSTPAFAHAQQPGATLTWQQARDKALSVVQGTVLELDWEWEGGRAAYEVEVLPQGGGMRREVLIDASNGAVLGNRVDGWDHFGPRGWDYDD